MSTSNGQLDRRVLVDEDADDRPRGIGCGLATVLTVSSTAFAAAPHGELERRRRARACRSLRAAAPACAPASPSTATMTSPTSSDSAAGTSGDTLVTRTPLGDAVDVVAERAQRDDRGDVLRPLHVLGVLAIASSSVVVVRRERPPGRASCPPGRVNGSELLEQRGSGARTGRRSRCLLACRARFVALDHDLVGERLRAVRHEEEVVRRQPPQHEGRDDADHAEDDRERRRSASRDAREPRVSGAVDQRRPRPLTYDARSEQRNATTSPISRVVPSRRSGIVRDRPRWAHRGRPRESAPCRCGPVRSQLTVMPFGPSSRASDFAQPMIPGRMAFESARLSIGSRTVRR